MQNCGEPVLKTSLSDAQSPIMTLWGLKIKKLKIHSRTALHRPTCSSGLSSRRPCKTRYRSQTDKATLQAGYEFQRIIYRTKSMTFCSRSDNWMLERWGTRLAMMRQTGPGQGTRRLLNTREQVKIIRERGTDWDSHKGGKHTWQRAKVSEMKGEIRFQNKTEKEKWDQQIQRDMSV